MNILYQYYNEIVLTFADYIVDFVDQKIVIEIPADNKSFESVCQKIEVQLNRIAGTLDQRDRVICVKIERGGEIKEILLDKEID